MSYSNYTLHLESSLFGLRLSRFLRKSISYCASNLNVAYSLGVISNVNINLYSLIYVIKK